MRLRSYNNEAGFVAPLIFLWVLIAALFVGTGVALVEYSSAKTDQSFVQWVWRTILHNENEQDERDSVEGHKMSQSALNAYFQKNVYGVPPVVRSGERQLTFTLSGFDTGSKELQVLYNLRTVSGRIELTNDRNKFSLSMQGSVDPETGVVKIEGSGDQTVLVNLPKISGSATTHYTATMTGTIAENGKASGAFILNSELVKTTGDIPFVPKKESASLTWHGST